MDSKHLKLIEMSFLNGFILERKYSEISYKSVFRLKIII